MSALTAVKVPAELMVLSSPAQQPWQPCTVLPPLQAGFLKDDPRTTRQLWQAALQPVVGSLSLEPDASGVAQLLNVAYARHELTSDSVDISLAWLEAGGATSLGALLEQQGQALPPLSSP